VHQDRADWFFRSLLTRLNKPNEGIVVVIGQRLHIDDPMGAIAQAMRMEAVAIPAIAQEDRAYDLGGGRSYEFRRGEVLHPALLDAEELASRRRSMGAADFSAQYLQDPVPDGGGALDFSMHRRFEHAPSNLMIFHCWDTARTAGGGDFTVRVGDCARRDRGAHRRSAGALASSAQGAFARREPSSEAKISPRSARFSRAYSASTMAWCASRTRCRGAGSKLAG
jgi:hypothetical protein